VERGGRGKKEENQAGLFKSVFFQGDDPEKKRGPPFESLPLAKRGETLFILSPGGLIVVFATREKRKRAFCWVGVQRWSALSRGNGGEGGETSLCESNPPRGVIDAFVEKTRGAEISKEAGGKCFLLW